MPAVLLEQVTNILGSEIRGLNFVGLLPELSEHGAPYRTKVILRAAINADPIDRRQLVLAEQIGKNLGERSFADASLSKQSNVQSRLNQCSRTLGDLGLTDREMVRVVDRSMGREGGMDLRSARELSRLIC